MGTKVWHYSREGIRLQRSAFEWGGIQDAADALLDEVERQGVYLLTFSEKARRTKRKKEENEKRWRLKRKKERKERRAQQKREKERKKKKQIKEFEKEIAVIFGREPARSNGRKRKAAPGKQMKKKSKKKHP